MNNTHVYKPCGCHLVQYGARDAHGSRSRNLSHYTHGRFLKMIQGGDIYTYECCRQGKVGLWFPCQGGWRCTATYWTVTQCLCQDHAQVVYDPKRDFLIPVIYAPPTGPATHVTDEQFTQYKQHAITADRQSGAPLFKALS